MCKCEGRHNWLPSMTPSCFTNTLTLELEYKPGTHIHIHKNKQNLCRSRLLPAGVYDLSWAGGGDSCAVDVIPAWGRWRGRFVGLVWALTCFSGFVLRLWWSLQACFDWQVGFYRFTQHCCFNGLFNLGFWSFIRSWFSGLLRAGRFRLLILCNTVSTIINVVQHASTLGLINIKIWQKGGESNVAMLFLK